MEPTFRIGDWMVCPRLNRLERNGRQVRLEPKVMQVLACLAERPGEMVSKEELLGKVWADTFVTDEVLTRAISELRRALEDDARQPRIIETVQRGGYRLIASTPPAAPAVSKPARHWRARVLISVAAAVSAILVLALSFPGGWAHLTRAKAP